MSMMYAKPGDSARRRPAADRIICVAGRPSCVPVMNVALPADFLIGFGGFVGNMLALLMTSVIDKN